MSSPAGTAVKSYSALRGRISWLLRTRKLLPLAYKFLALFQTFTTPEWVAAIALLIQARILWRHAHTLEEHARIASSQAHTAELIGQALRQQGQILDEQTKIMDEQFKFQRRLEVKAERTKIFDLLMQVRISVAMLQRKMMERNISDEEMSGYWERLTSDVPLCMKELHTSIQISGSEKQYFLGYVRAVAALQRTGDILKDIENVKALHDKYQDFNKKMFAAAETPSE